VGWICSFEGKNKENRNIWGENLLEDSYLRLLWKMKETVLMYISVDGIELGQN
jgi:hypothetical protein